MPCQKEPATFIYRFDSLVYRLYICLFICNSVLLIFEEHCLEFYTCMEGLNCNVAARGICVSKTHFI